MRTIDLNGGEKQWNKVLNFYRKKRKESSEEKRDRKITENLNKLFL
jgi:hypothetical protein